MTTLSPLPVPPQADAPYTAPAPVPTPAAVRQALTPPPRRRLDPAQAWTLVVAGAIGLVAVVTSIAVGASGSDSAEEGLSRLFEDGGAGLSEYYEDDDESGCYSVYC